MPKLKIKLKKDIEIKGYRTLKADTVYETVRENSRYVYIEENRLLIRLLRSDCEEIKRGRKNQIKGAKMKTLTFHINYDNQIYTYKSGTEAMIFDYGVNSNLDRKYGLKTLREYVALVYELYLSDSNETPLGKLCDYVATHWERLKTKGRYDILEEFYLKI